MFTHFFAGCLVAAAAIPDVIMPDTRTIKVDVRLNAQPLIEHCCFQYVVGKNETLGTIAARHRNIPNTTPLTTVAEILELNPGLDADKVTKGTRLWMPPKDLSSAMAARKFLFTSGHYRLPMRIRPFVVNQKIEKSKHGTYSFLLVPESLIDKWNKALKANTIYEIYGKLIKEKAIEVLKVSGSGSFVKDASPVHSCIDTIDVKRDKSGAYSLTCSSIAFDKAGKVVPESERYVDQTKVKKSALLLLFPLAGAGWLLSRSVRQSQPQVTTAS
jgi:hypothetical protein